MRRKYYLFLFVLFAGIITACDPVARPYFTVDRIFIEDNTIFIHVSEKQSWGIGYVEENIDHYFVSQDEGKTWREVSSVPFYVPPAKKDPVFHPIKMCVRMRPSICYLIDGKERVEISNDGGYTWQIDWMSPPGRKKYMARNNAINSFESVEPDTVPLDLGILSMGNRHIVIVAMGNQGVLVKSPSGDWERYAVSNETEFPSKLGFPLAYYATNFNEVKEYLFFETLLVDYFTIAFFIALSLLGWIKTFRAIDGKTRSMMVKSRASFLFIETGIIFMIFLLIANFLHPILSNPLEYICIIPMMGGWIAIWSIMIAISPNQKSGVLAAFGSLGYALVFFVSIWLPLALWAIGFIPIYEISLTIACVTGFLCVYIGIRHEKCLVTLATLQLV